MMKTECSRKAIKNPFAKIHQAAINNGGFLSDEVRKKMMKEAINELRCKTRLLYDTEEHSVEMMPMKTERSFHILKKVTADWDEIDKLVADILAADKNNEVDFIAISYLDIDKNGVLNDDFMPIVSGKDFPGFEIEEAVEFRNRPDYVRNDMLPRRCIFLYSREDQ